MNIPSNQFPNEVIDQYIRSCNKLKKIQRVVFKRFAPNIAECSDEFNKLALNFDNSYLPEYAGLCYLGTAKCENTAGNKTAEIDFLLRGARAFNKANNKNDALKLDCDNFQNLEGAFRCYNQALSNLEDDSVMKAAIIRELKNINHNTENLSNFSSPCHRIYDLEVSSNENIKNGEFVSALEKLTEIYDDIVERKVEDLYEDVLKRNEIARLLILLILNLPPSRYSPSHIKLLERYSSDCQMYKSNSLLPDRIILQFQGLVAACNSNNIENIIAMRNKLSKYPYLTPEHKFLLNELIQKYTVIH